MEVVEPKFTKIVDGLKGSEGPVFDKDCNFYMVAPEVTKNDSFAGQVLSIDVENNKVWTGKLTQGGGRHLFTCRFKATTFTLSIRCFILAQQLDGNDCLDDAEYFKDVYVLICLGMCVIIHRSSTIS